MFKSRRVRLDASVLLAVVVAAALAAGIAAMSADPESGTESSGGLSRPASVAEAHSRLIDYLNAVGAASDAADPSMDTIGALLSGTASDSL